jgi:hypothetical protein
LRTFSKTFGGFVAKNPSFSVFLAGFLGVLRVSIAWWSVPVAVSAAGDFDAVAVFPYVSRKG